LSTLDDMRRAIDALDARGGGELILAASLMPSMVLIPQVLRQYADQYPGVSVKLQTLPSEVVVQEIARSGVDLGIAGDVPMPAEVASEQILVDELIGIAAAGLLGSNGGRVSPGELARHSLLIGAEGSSTRAVTERYLARSEYRPARVWEFNSYEAIKRAVADGLGVSFLSRLLAREEIERGELTTFRVRGMEPMERPIFSLHSAVTALSPQAAAFMALLTNTGWRTTDRRRSK
jgi:DNA-binding transcriptional LysR family regulator